MRHLKSNYKEDTKLRIHWFALTFFGDRQEFEKFYKTFLEDTFGKYVEKGHGGRGYKSIANAGVGVRLYFDPISIGKKGNHIHIEIPGEACDCLLPDHFHNMMKHLVYERIKEDQLQINMMKITRLDFAFDHDYFTPDQWYEAIQGQDIVTLAKRDSIRIDQSPYALRDDGQIGTTTVYLGSNESGRMLRVYNKRGPTRLELQMRDDRAFFVSFDVLLRSPSVWHEAGLAHVIQYVNFREGLEPDWWLEFTKSIQSSDLVISSSRVASLKKMDKWLKKQVAVALSVVHDVEGDDYIKDLIEEARKRDRSRYDSILQLKE